MCRKNRSSDDDTIVAIITPPGEGGIAAVRLAGRHSRYYLKKFFVHTRESVPLKPFVMHYGSFVSAAGETIDEITAVYMPKGKSYTGLEQVEVFCHGGRQIVRLILQELVNAGARPAEPGEFTRLAFLNGNIDLAKAEAVAEIIAADTEHSYQASREHLLGAYSRHIEQLREDLVNVAAEVEAGIDFGEEEIELAPGIKLKQMIDHLIDRVKELADSYRGGRIIREGFKVVIGGRANAGKSSLFNLLLRQERALVNPFPGTTRDYLSEWIDLEGFAVNLIDTAGLRTGGGTVEKAGRAHAHRLIRDSDLLVWMIDLSRKNYRVNLQKDLPALPKCPILLVGNKIDLLLKNRKQFKINIEGVMPLSCTTGRGIGLLKKELVRRIEANMPDITSGLVVTSLRHKQKLHMALRNLKQARTKVAYSESLELAAFDLRQAISALDEITGRIYTEEVLGKIFSRFCVGK